MGLWDNIKARLGLGDDWEGEYDEYDDESYGDEDEDAGDGFVGRSAYETPYPAGTTGVRRVEREPEQERVRSNAPRTERTHLRSVSSQPEVARVTPQVKMHIVEPKSFTEAQSIADKFKQGTPVIMNMSMTSPDLAKRLIDFASGLTYGLDGGLQKVSDKVFMLTPANVDVSAGDFSRLSDKGMFTIDS